MHHGSLRAERVGDDAGDLGGVAIGRCVYDKDAGRDVLDWLNLRRAWPDTNNDGHRARPTARLGLCNALAAGHTAERQGKQLHIDAQPAAVCGQISASNMDFLRSGRALCVGVPVLPFDTSRKLLVCCSSLRGPHETAATCGGGDVGLALAAPAAAQRYTAKQDGDVIELADTTAQMNVSVVWSMSNAWRIQVKGKDLVRTSATLADFQARPGFNGMPLLAPFANRLDETAFYANGKKYNFDLELGNVRGPIPSTGFVNGSKAWQLVEFKADGKGAWVTCRLDFYKNPQYMQQFPFAHTITMTYRVADGALEVRTRLDNLSTEPMPVVIGYHPIYELPDGNSQRLDGVGGREDALDRNPAAAPDR